MSGLPDWSTAATAQLAGGWVRAGVFLRIATDPVIRVWAGDGAITLDIDLIEDDDTAQYLGFGDLGGALPTVSQLINGEADRVSFSLSGALVTPQIIALASSDASTLRGSPVNLGLRAFDADWQALSPTAWLWEGNADQLSLDYSDGVGTITLSVGSLLTGRRRPTPSSFTDPDQRRRSADDRFCERVATYNVGTTMLWPK